MFPKNVQYLGLIALFACLLVPTLVLAGTLPPEVVDQTAIFAGDEGAAFTVTSDPRLVIARSVRIIVSLLGTIFLIYGFWGGYQVFLSRGDESQISKGKSTIVTATIGVLVMLSAYSVTLFVTKSVQRAAGIDPRYSDDGGWDVRVEIDPERDINPDPLAPPPDPGRIIR